MSWNDSSNRYPPPQQGLGPPPPGHYGGRPQSPYDQLPQQQWNAPPQQQFGYPPQQQYGAPPPNPQAYGAPPHLQQTYGAQQPYGALTQQYGAPNQQYGTPPQQYGALAQQYGMPTMQHHTPPSPGYDPQQVINVDTMRDADALRSAMKGMGTKESHLIQVLSRISDPLIMANLRQTYDRRFMRDLVKDLGSETRGYFQEGLEAIARGPLAQDIHNLNDALKGAGTKESVLNDVLLARSNADINSIKHEYQRVYRRSLESDVKDDLSLKTERLFTMVLSAQRADESAPIIPQQLERDVSEIHRATEGTKLGTDQITICQIFSSRSDGQLRALSQEFQRRYTLALSKVIEREFSGHMEDALLRILHAAEDRAMADAKALEQTMAGPGTKDRLLLNRLVRIHWNREHMGQVKRAYRHHFKRDLSARIHGETSGDYRKLMMALVEQV